MIRLSAVRYLLSAESASDGRAASADRSWPADAACRLARVLLSVIILPDRGPGKHLLPSFFRHGRRRGRLPGGKGCLLKGPRVMPYHINKARGGKPSFAGAIRPRLRNGDFYAHASECQKSGGSNQQFGGVDYPWHVLRVLTCPETSASKPA